MAKISVIGAGTWGIALARLLANNNNDVLVWSAVESEIDMLSASYKHPNLPETELPRSIKFTKDLHAALSEREIVLMAVPSVFVRSTAKRVNEFIEKDALIVDAAKGMEDETLMTMSEIIEDEIKGHSVVALSGPTHAEEVARDLPTTIVAACEDLNAAKKAQEAFMTPFFRVYTNTDRRGAEIAGAIKNVVALGVGMSRGLGYGDNTSAALITRALAEIVRLGSAMGCKKETFYGLAGVGDLIVTCTSVHSRNFKAGRLMGEGKSAAEAVKEVGMVVEGMNMLPAAMKLREKYGVEMPITEIVDAVVNRNYDPKKAVAELMLRDKREE